MNAKQLIPILIFIMMSVAIGVGSIAIAMLYDTAIEEEQARLQEVAQSQARLLESVAWFDSIHSSGEGDTFDLTLSQFREAHERFLGFGKSGEFTLAYYDETTDEIAFLLRHRHGEIDELLRVPFESELAEPMRRALSSIDGGTLTGKDYRGEVVLAAFEPIVVEGQPPLGIVAKIDLEEVRQPFINAGLWSAAGAMVFILVGIFFFLRIGNPIVERVEQSEERLRQFTEAATESFTLWDAELNLVNINETGLRYYGIEGQAERIIGKNMIEILPNVVETGRVVQYLQVIQTGEPIIIDDIPAESTIGKRHLIVRAFKVGNGLGMITSDVTQQKQMEEALRMSRDELELRIEERTTELVKTNELLHQEIAERKRIEATLRESELRYRNLFHQVPIGLYRTTSDGRFLDANQSFADMLAYPDIEAVLASNVAENYIDKADRETWKHELERKGSVTDYQLRFRRRDGEPIWIETNARIVKDNGETYYDGAIQDITERKQVEALLLDALNTMEMLYNFSSALIAIRDLSALLQMIADNLVQSLSADRVTMITFNMQDKQVLNFIKSGPGSDNVMTVDFAELQEGLAGWVLRELKPALSPKSQPDPRESPEVQRRRLETNCGDIIVVPLLYGERIQGVITAINTPEGRDFMQSDVELIVTLANQAAVAIENIHLISSLQHSERFLSDVMNSVADAVFTVKMPERQIQFVNSTVSEMFGYAPEAVIGQSTRMFYPDEASYLFFGQRLRKALESGQLHLSLEQELVQHDGKHFWGEISTTFLYADGQLSQVISVVRDISERKQAERQQLELMLNKERMHILSNFITQASHEFRTPLSTINLSTHLINMATTPEMTQRHIEKIGISVRHITDLVDSMTLMSRLDSIRDLVTRAVDINEVVRNVYMTRLDFIQAKGIQGAIQRSEKPIMVNANVDYLYKAIEVIVENAIKFSNEGDTITVTTKMNEDSAVVAIIDTGIGIAEADLPHIFERFYRSDKAGTTRGFGLGLPIAKASIELHKGSIEVESTVGEGSTFRILLPVT